jgi:Transposase domain (DUF772)/Transposase DDE domain
MGAPRWNPPVEIEKREERVMRRLTRNGKLFAFLRRERHAIFDSAFQDELAAMYREGDDGKVPVPPAQLAMAILLQAYAGVSDAEAVERAAFDARWQMVLGTLGDDEPPFAQGTLSAFRERLITHDMDRRLLERTIDFARASKGFDSKKLPKSLRLAVDSRPLVGAGRVEDTVNLLGRAGRQMLISAAEIAGVDVDDLAEEIHATLLLESSIKAGLDTDWTDPKQKAGALRTLLEVIESLEKYVREQLAAHAAAPPLAGQLAIIAKLREQDIDPDPPDGGGPTVRDGVAPDRTISLSDREMRHGRKSKSRTFNGFKSHIATDLDHGIVLGCAVLPANRPEREGLDAMRADLERVGGDAARITELHVDRGYTGAELTQQLATTPSAEVVSKPRPTVGKDGLFGKRDFKIDLRKKTATCPEGQTVPIALGEVARFDADTCSDCPRRAQCTAAAAGKGRTLSIADDELMQRGFARLVATSTGRERLRERVAIEHSIARHTQIQGKQARYTGTRKNLYDSRRIGALMNLECAQRELADAA